MHVDEGYHLAAQKKYFKQGNKEPLDTHQVHQNGCTDYLLPGSNINEHRTGYKNNAYVVCFPLEEEDMHAFTCLFNLFSGRNLKVYAKSYTIKERDSTTFIPIKWAPKYAWNTSKLHSHKDKGDRSIYPFLSDKTRCVYVCEDYKVNHGTCLWLLISFMRIYLEGKEFYNKIFSNHSVGEDFIGNKILSLFALGQYFYTGGFNSFSGYGLLFNKNSFYNAISSCRWNMSSLHSQTFALRDDENIGSYTRKNIINEIVSEIESLKRPTINSCYNIIAEKVKVFAIKSFLKEYKLNLGVEIEESIEINKNQEEISF